MLPATRLEQFDAGEGQNSMSVLIFANGDMSPGKWTAKYLERASALIAADGGLRHIQSLGRMPDLVIGDLDSVGSSELAELEQAGAEMVAYPEDKDATDLQLALQYAAKNYDDDILLFGALGGRLDQLLANILLLTDQCLHGRKARIVEEHQQAWLMDAGVHEFQARPGDLISLLPLRGDVRIKRSAGLRWPLQDDDLIFGSSRGISNELTNETALIEVGSGTALCIHTEMAWRR